MANEHDQKMINKRMKNRRRYHPFFNRYDVELRTRREHTKVNLNLFP